MTFRVIVSTAAGVGLALLAGLTARGQSAELELKVGDQAPAFALPGSDGRTHRLADHTGKSTVVLAWFPKAFTGG